MKDSQYSAIMCLLFCNLANGFTGTERVINVCIGIYFGVRHIIQSGRGK